MSYERLIPDFISRDTPEESLGSKNSKITKTRFLAALPAIREAARNLGYAIGLHGSLERDFDLIAVPWVEDAAEPDDLAQAVFEAAGGVRWRVWWNRGNPKPHGRKAYAFDWDRSNRKNKDYCDLSVMPRLK